MTVTITPIWMLSCTACGLAPTPFEDEETLERARRFHNAEKCTAPGAKPPRCGVCGRRHFKPNTPDGKCDVVVKLIRSSAGQV